MVKANEPHPPDGPSLNNIGGRGAGVAGAGVGVGDELPEENDIKAFLASSNMDV